MKKRLTQTELLQIVDLGYSDFATCDFWNGTEVVTPPSGETDQLARFVVQELVDTFQEHDAADRQIQNAINVLNEAARDLDSVKASLQEFKDAILSGKDIEEEMKEVQAMLVAKDHTIGDDQVADVATEAP